MIRYMKKQVLFGLTMLAALTGMAVPAEEPMPADSAVSVAENIPSGADPIGIAQKIRAQIEDAAMQLIHEKQIESLNESMSHTQFLLTGESEVLLSEAPETEFAEETETEYPEETEQEKWPVEMAPAVQADTAFDAADKEGETEVSPDDPSAETETSSDEDAAEASEETPSLRIRRGALAVPDPGNVNIARVNPYDYRMIRSYPLPLLPKDLHRLYDQLQELLSGFEGEWSVYVQNLSTNQTLVLNDTALNSASVMKLFIMETVYEAFDNGSLTRDEDMVYLLRSMIINSSNESSNRLLNILGDGDLATGIARVNDFISRHGYTPQTVIHNGFQDPAATLDPDTPNVVRARDVGLLLSRVYNREFISRKVCNEIESMMLEQGTRYKIPRGVPDGVDVGNKSGETSDTANDAAVVYSPGVDYILVVLSHGWTNENAANENVVKVSQLVYGFFDS